MRLGTGEIIVLLVVVLLVFGAAKIPQLGDALGKGIRNFKKAAGGGGVLEMARSAVEEPARLVAAVPPPAPAGVVVRVAEKR